MKLVIQIASALVAAVTVHAVALAQEADKMQPPGARKPAAETVCGSKMMTSKERAEHRQQMHDARSPAERERIRADHHEAMQGRAKERGIKLDDHGCRGHDMKDRGMGHHGNTSPARSR